MKQDIHFSKDDVDEYIKANHKDLIKFCSVDTYLKQVDSIDGSTRVIPMVEVSFSIPISELG